MANKLTIFSSDELLTKIDSFFIISYYEKNMIVVVKSLLHILPIISKSITQTDEDATIVDFALFFFSLTSSQWLRET